MNGKSLLAVPHHHSPIRRSSSRLLNTLLSHSSSFIISRVVLHSLPNGSVFLFEAGRTHRGCRGFKREAPPVLLRLLLLVGGRCRRPLRVPGGGNCLSSQALMGITTCFTPLVGRDTCCLLGKWTPTRGLCVFSHRWPQGCDISSICYPQASLPGTCSDSFSFNVLALIGRLGI